MPHDNHNIRGIAAAARSGDLNCQKQELPIHLETMSENSKSELDKYQQCALRSLLVNYLEVFATNDFDFGDFTAIDHNNRPIKQRMCRSPMCFENEEEAHLKQMLDAGIIEPSVSEWASTFVLIRKRDGKVRCCIDYRKLNYATKQDVYPLSLMEECIETLSGNVWFSKDDANSAYYQVEVSENDRDKTAFITKYGLFQFVRMRFGLCNAPCTYMRVMNLVLKGLHLAYRPSISGRHGSSWEGFPKSH